jgi:hypothetical protein
VFRGRLVARYGRPLESDDGEAFITIGFNIRNTGDLVIALHDGERLHTFTLKPKPPAAVLSEPTMAVLSDDEALIELVSPHGDTYEGVVQVPDGAVRLTICECCYDRLHPAYPHGAPQ